LKKVLIPAAALIAVACSNSGGETAAAPAAGGTGFAAVSQILSTNCMPCHSAQGHKGGWSAASYADAMKAGEDGPVIVPGDPDASLIVQVLKGPVPDKTIPQMPMKRAPLSEADQKVIYDWIKAGAKES
jgi:cytochrome c